MVDVMLSQDPVLRARSFLKRYFERVEIQVPHDWLWKTTLIVLRDGLSLIHISEPTRPY